MDTAEAQNWIGGTALLVTAVGLWREMRVRNRDRRDAEAGQARMVILVKNEDDDPVLRSRDTDRPRTSLETEVTVTNFSAAPILDLLVRIDARWYGVRDHKRTESSAVFGVLKPGQSRTGSIHMSWDEPRTMRQIDRWATMIEFTDIAGLNWLRINNGRPHRVIRSGSWRSILSALRHEPQMLWRSVRQQYPFD